MCPHQRSRDSQLCGRPTTPAWGLTGGTHCTCTLQFSLHSLNIYSASVSASHGVPRSDNVFRSISVASTALRPQTIADEFFISCNSGCHSFSAGQKEDEQDKHKHYKILTATISVSNVPTTSSGTIPVTTRSCYLVAVSTVSSQQRGALSCARPDLQTPKTAATRAPEHPQRLTRTTPTILQPTVLNSAGKAVELTAAWSFLFAQPKVMTAPLCPQHKQPMPLGM